jgi:hypothetical protein
MHESVKVIFAVLGPIIFLFSETAGCVMTDRGFKRDCDRLVACNFVTVLQFSMSAIFYLGTEISNQHLSREDKIALRNGVDAGIVCR